MPVDQTFKMRLATSGTEPSEPDMRLLYLVLLGGGAIAVYLLTKK
jgi:hypothetical protein